MFAEYNEVRAKRVDARIVDHQAKTVTTLEMSCPWIQNREKKDKRIRRYRSSGPYAGCIILFIYTYIYIFFYFMLLSYLYNLCFFPLRLFLRVPGSRPTPLVAAAIWHPYVYTILS